MGGVGNGRYTVRNVARYGRSWEWWIYVRNVVRYGRGWEWWIHG